MNKTVFSIALMATAFAGHPGYAAPVVPSYDTFGSLPAATFGGSGIPNDAVAISTFIDGSGNTVTLGLTAHQRYSNPPLTNNGAGTFFATPGANFGNDTPPPSSTLGATWNFAWYVRVTGPNAPTSLAGYQITLLYDFDPGANTEEANLGVLDIDFTFGTANPQQNSQNLLFGYLDFLFPPFGTPPVYPAFDPFAAGEYSFRLTVVAPEVDSVSSRLLLADPGSVSINVNVAEVPEPATLALFGSALLGLGIARRRRMRAA